ncbi:MAG: hypothetical protein DRJ49_02715 [Thermoprotei archaeon]|nr:MAG: hypothetical protein DRJ49_02715 [Thermoprotei archaeon]
MLVIKPTPLIATYCYSIFRLETYTSCSLGCAYCYGNWYREDRSIRPSYDVLKLFKKIVLEVSRKSLKPYPFRMSTLVDPFQDLEKEYMISYKIMELALKYDYPLIINTKTTLIFEDPWMDLLVEMAERGLVVLQFSILGLDKIEKLEPLVPHPLEILDLVKELRRRTYIPIVFRLQPLIPGLNDSPEYLEDVLRELKRVHPLHVIIEYLRTTSHSLGLYERLALDKSPYKIKWEFYSREGKIVKPPLYYRLRRIREIKRIAEEMSIRVVSCKEGVILDYLDDCCGFYALRNCIKRITLREILRRDYSLIRSRYISDRDVRLYPNPIRKALRWYSKVLTEILRDNKFQRRIRRFELDIR